VSISPPTAPPAAESAYRHVKELILSDQLTGGTMISEGEIATRLSVSRTPVREAFLRLEAEGWLRLYPKRGALVVPVGPGEAQAVIDARLLIEGHAVEAVAGGEDEPRARLVARLGESVERQRAALAEGDLDAYSYRDAEFHLMIVSAGGNPLLMGFYGTLRDRQRRMVARSLWRGEGHARAFVDSHEQLAGLIAAGDATAFHDALCVHLHEAHLPQLAAEARAAR
jgi:DNA-binding GntR family transcriptional regulator